MTTYLFSNHAVRTEKFRYIQYADGGEELYDETADPLEWKNLASDSNYAAVKKDLAQWLPKVNVPTPAEGKAGEGKAKANLDDAAKKARRAAKGK